MKTRIAQHKIVIMGAILGAIAGFVYWKYVGCLTGTCAITLHPVRSTVYGAVMGGLLFSFFKTPLHTNVQKDTGV